MQYKSSADSAFLPLQFKKNSQRHQTWWAPVWRGLLVEQTGKHYRVMRSAVWLYLYLVVHADRKTGTLFRRISTIAQDMGITSITIRRWLTVLRNKGYVRTERTGRALKISIARWKPLRSQQY